MKVAEPIHTPRVSDWGNEKIAADTQEILRMLIRIEESLAEIRKAQKDAST